jgi:hypothetical protein
LTDIAQNKQNKLRFLRAVYDLAGGTPSGEVRGEDKEELRELLAQIRDLLVRGETVERGFLARFGDLLNKYGWLATELLHTQPLTRRSGKRRRAS